MSEDYDYEAEDLKHLASVKEKELGDPALVVSDLHVTYRVLAGKRVASEADRKGLLQRLLSQGRKQVGGATLIKAVRGVSFIARHGESIGVVGVNGSGKSTLLRGVAGLIPPAQGTVYAAGEISLLGVNAAMMKALSGERNIMIGGLALGLSKQEVKERFDEIVDFAGIGEFVYMPMKTYSSGMAARLQFAISSAASPDILMIDEALATGDAEFRRKSGERIDVIRERAGTVFLVSHSLGTIRQMCSRVMWLNKGELIADGPTDVVADLYDEFVKAKNAKAKQAVLKKAAVEAGPRL